MLDYIQNRNRNLRRFDAPILKEVKSNNRCFEKKCTVSRGNHLEQTISG